MQMQNRCKLGFTLIEVMVVIIIMGFLAAIAVPIAVGAIERSRENIDRTKLFYLREALNKALVVSEDALSSTTTVKTKNASEMKSLLDKMYRVLKTDAGATLFVIEVHNGLSVNVQNSHNDANNANNISEILGTSGTWCDALNEAGFEGVADIIADRITGNYKKDTDTYTSFEWHDDVKNKNWQRTAPKKPMFISQALNKGKKAENTRYTMNVRWSDPSNPGHSVEVFLLPNGKNWQSAYRTDHGVCFSTYGPAGCANSD
jgi:prepilin-type N-terminal cleavage/methylation domain-containing protein